MMKQMLVGGAILLALAGMVFADVCNNDAVCDSGEQCGCRDCIGSAAACSSGLLCSSSGACMENCTSLTSGSVHLSTLFSYSKTMPDNANVFGAVFDSWIVDEFGNMHRVEVGVKTW
jgi:hypothetical protein